MVAESKIVSPIQFSFQPHLAESAQMKKGMYTTKRLRMISH